METHAPQQTADRDAEEQVRQLPKKTFDDFLSLLRADGYEVIGPKIDQAAIVYGPIHSSQDLPIGWTDRQAAGSYRLEQREDRAYFGYAVGPHSWKKFLFPAVLPLWSAHRTENSFEVTDAAVDPPKRALLGVRACELHAIAVQDRVFIDREGRFTDPYYAEARKRLLLIAVECEDPAGTCFCASMGTGPHMPALKAVTPRAELPIPGPQQSGRVALAMATEVGTARGPVRPSYDLAMTELDDSFVIRSGSPTGSALLDRLQLDVAAPTAIQSAQLALTRRPPPWAAHWTLAILEACFMPTRNIHDGMKLRSVAFRVRIARWFVRPVSVRASRKSAI